MNEPSLRLRRVEPSDARLLWGWANDPQTRQASFNSDPIPLATHERWLAGRLGDPEAVLLLAEDDGGEPVGVVRFEPRGPDRVISVTIAPTRRGKGLGHAVIRSACEWLRNHRKTGLVIAEIKATHVASQRAFLRAGFAETGRTVLRGFEAIVMSTPRPAGS